MTTMVRVVTAACVALLVVLYLSQQSIAAPTVPGKRRSSSSLVSAGWWQWLVSPWLPHTTPRRRLSLSTSSAPKAALTAGGVQKGRRPSLSGNARSISTVAPQPSPPTDPSITEVFRIGAFNIQTLNLAKLQSSNPLVPIIISRILARYDIVLVQEIRDRSEKTVYELLRQVNNVAWQDECQNMNWYWPFGWQSTEMKHLYNVTFSAPLGRTHSKERYAYLYRNDRIRVVDQMVFQGDQSHVFERPPMALLFEGLRSEYGKKVESKDPNRTRYALIGVHIQPRAAVEELDALPAVLEAVSKKWQSPHTLLLGDFNADCKYVKRSSWGDDATSSSTATDKSAKVVNPSSSPNVASVPSSTTSSAPSSSWFPWSYSSTSVQMQPSAHYSSLANTKSGNKKTFGKPKNRRQRDDEDFLMKDSSEDDDSGIDERIYKTKNRRRLYPRMVDDSDGEDYDSSVELSDSDSSNDDSDSVSCSTLLLKPQSPLLMARDPKYIWLLSTGQDTTTSIKRACTLDRLVVLQKDQAMIEYPAKVFYYAYADTSKSLRDISSPPIREKDDDDDEDEKVLAPPARVDRVPWYDNSQRKRLKVPIDTVAQISDHFPIEVQVRLRVYDN